MAYVDTSIYQILDLIPLLTDIQAARTEFYKWVEMSPHVFLTTREIWGINGKCYGKTTISELENKARYLFEQFGKLDSQTYQRSKEDLSMALVAWIAYLATLKEAIIADQDSGLHYYLEGLKSFPMDGKLKGPLHTIYSVIKEEKLVPIVRVKPRANVVSIAASRRTAQGSCQHLMFFHWHNDNCLVEPKSPGKLAHLSVDNNQLDHWVDDCPVRHRQKCPRSENIVLFPAWISTGDAAAYWAPHHAVIGPFTEEPLKDFVQRVIREEQEKNAESPKKKQK